MRKFAHVLAKKILNRQDRNRKKYDNNVSKCRQNLKFQKLLNSNVPKTKTDKKFQTRDILQRRKRKIQNSQKMLQKIKPFAEETV